MTRFLLLLLLTLAPLCAAHAVDVDVYSGEVPVTGQSAGERRRVLPAALKHVLQKLSGVRQFDEYPQVDAALGRASSILVSFHYRNVESVLPDGTEQTELRLVARFAPTEVDGLARQLQLPLWQPDRKPTEVWVIVDSGRNRQVMPVELAYVRAAMDEAAAGRGLPLTWPEADEEGQYPVDMQLLWGGYTEDLASPRGDGVLILAARREGSVWGVRSNLGYEGDNWAWRIQDIDLEAALVDAIQKTADQVASVEAIAASDLGTWQYELTIAGLNNASDYERCLAYLKGINVVDSIAVVEAQPKKVSLQLRLNALPLYFEDAVSSGSVLQLDESEEHFELVKGMTNDR